MGHAPTLKIETEMVVLKDFINWQEIVAQSRGREERLMSHRNEGNCFCGAISIEASGTPVEIGFCHCKSCRSYSGATMTAFTLWRDEDVKIVKGEEFLGGYNKVGKSDRRFCIRCGGHVMTYHPGFGYTDICASVLPSVPFIPTVHLNYAEAVYPIRDSVTKLKDFPEHAGGSGEIITE